MIGRLKLVGPATPATLVAVTAITVVAIAVGVPVSRPVDERLAQAGRPVADHVMGAVPVAVN